MDQIESIPQIDFAAYGLHVDTKNVSQKQLEALAHEICRAYRTVGFVYLKNHGIPEEKVNINISISTTIMVC